MHISWLVQNDFLGVKDASVFLRNVLVILAKCVNRAEAKHLRDFTISLCTMDIVSYFPQHQFVPQWRRSQVGGWKSL